MADYDLAIIGGGINGTGIARDAVGRGLRVLLLEQNDLGSGTSSASTKLIHGGLRYLEHGALRLVREALTEREVLLRMAPHLIRPMRFMLPAIPGDRKSTRLNSSHPSISYAVFCLKKKKKNKKKQKTISITQQNSSTVRRSH